MDSTRRLALRLHALHDDDRVWLLRQLDGESQQRLRILLDEINDIGLVPDSVLMAFAGEAGATTLEPAMQIGLASSDLVFQVLRNEPVTIRRYLMQVHQWPWLSDLSQEQMLSLQGGTDTPRSTLFLAPRAHLALVKSFADHLAETVIPPRHFAAATRPTFFQRIKKAGQWLR